MRIIPIDTGMFKLDGGAMYGVVPKSLWQRQNPADENNMCSWAMRCLLVEDGDRLILIDSGLGNKQDAKFFGHYDLHGDGDLKTSIRKAGYDLSEVTDHVLTHLHFDHCGGSIQWDEKREKLELTFPNAKYWVSERQWNWATHPNPREKASFLKENFMLMQESGHLELTQGKFQLTDNINMDEVLGHTEGMYITTIIDGQQKYYYMADLIPSRSHVPLAWVMGYDTQPLLTLGEKELWLKEIHANNGIMILEHDPVVAACPLELTDRGLRGGEPISL